MQATTTTAAGFNRAHALVLAAGHLTLGLMTPLVRAPGQPADVAAELALAARAGALGVAALWTRDVPLIIPQGSSGDAAVLDDPFVWLAALALAAPQAAIGTAAAVLPLRHPLHLAKAAWSLDRMSGGRLILGLGSGDRPQEFAAFGVGEGRDALLRERWAVLRAALAPGGDPALQAVTGGFAPTAPPQARIPLLAVGSMRQSLQWIAAHADGWATYHREEARQQGRIALWHQALRERAGGLDKPFVQSLQLELLDDPHAPAVPLELGLRAGRHALLAYLERMAGLGVAHMLLNLQGARPVAAQLEELGAHVVPRLPSMTTRTP
ncbi:TIGR03571 family LLM class oxidoreductase [uncultured Massilia sp.]|uniref:TIGR03571 family LLM class oxidoreductase n=1 Tax=uncultured Massilia sp. TaxID=169973 RepID=UPI0025FE985D|nr:TIGR03571 family LLM class oxidoreductase [uncultured Massilia sp.]